MRARFLMALLAFLMVPGAAPAQLAVVLPSTGGETYDGRVILIVERAPVYGIRSRRCRAGRGSIRSAPVFADITVDTFVDGRTSDPLPVVIGRA